MNRVYEVTRRPTIGYALLVAALATFSYTASYAKGADFISGTVMVNTVFSTMASNGAITSTLLFTGLFCTALICMIVGRVATPRTRWWSLGVAGLTAFSLTIPLFIPEGKTALFTVARILPTLPSGEKTKWYWLFMVVRYIGYALFVELLLRALFSVATRNADSPDRELFDWSDYRGLISRLRYAIDTRVWSHLGWFRSAFSSWSVRSVAVVGLLLAVMWLPWMVLLYPANIAADTVAQLVWARGYTVWDPSSRQDIPWAHMSDQHPWFDTVVYGWFDRLGVLAGNEAYGLYALAVSQTLLCAGSVALLLCYVGGRLHVSWKWCTLGVAWYAMIPIFGRLPMSVVKDSTFIPFFLVWLTLFMEYVRRLRARECLGIWLPGGLVILAIYCGLTKKTGIYVATLGMVIVMVALNKRLVSLLCAVLSLVLFVGITDVAFSALRVAPAGKQEELAIPLQQTANLLLLHESDISAADRSTIDRVFSCNTPQVRAMYSSEIGDPIKDHCFNRGATNSDIARFLVVWMKQGLIHPRTYIDATAWLRDPFTMGAIYDEGFYVHWGWSEKGGLDILSQYKVGQRSQPQRYGATLYYMLAKLPIFGLLMSENIYVLWIPLIGVALCVLRRRTWNLLYAVPLLLSVLTLPVSPGYQTRYSWSLAYGFFVFVMLAWIPDNSGKRYLGVPPKNESSDAVATLIAGKTKN